MNSIKGLAPVVAAFGLMTINLIVTLPVKAAVSCKNDTVTRYPNGSVNSCILDNNFEVSIGSLAFSCKQGYSIAFDEKSYVKTCVLANIIEIRKGNEIQKCPVDSHLYISSSLDGIPSVSCW